MNHAVRPLAWPTRAPPGSAGVVAMPPAAARPAPRAAPEAPTGAAALRERLQAAQRAARAGQIETARWLCAGAILCHQPLLVGSVPLLRQTIAALLACGAFDQLARLLPAVRGRTVQFRPGLAAARALAPPADGAEYMLDPGWFARADAGRIIRHWAAVLARSAPAAARGPKPASVPEQT